jgi:hypothetical protein
VMPVLMHQNLLIGFKGRRNAIDGVVLVHREP